MANDEYIDLDEIYKDSDTNKKTSEQVQKKEKVQENKIVQESPQIKTESVESNKIKEDKKEQKSELKSESKSDSEVKSEENKSSKKQTSFKKEQVVSKKNLKKAVPPKKISLKKSANMTSKSNNSKKEKHAKETNRKKETSWTTIALLIIAAVIVAVIIYLALTKTSSYSNKETVIAVVNGEPIYKSDVSSRYNLLSATMDPFITEEQILNMTIIDVLLVQEAKKRGISTSDDEIERLMESIMAQNGIDDESLRKDLESKNVSYEFILKLYKNTMTITKLLNESTKDIVVSEKEVSDFYELNKELLKVPDMVQVRHLLLLFGEESESETYARAKEIEDMIKPDKSNFCELVSEYTEDEASMNSCGEYNFSMNYPFVPEFLEAGFDMKEDEIRIVKTQLGYHVMYKLKDLPGYTPQLRELKPNIEAMLLEEKSLETYTLLIDELQKNAIIEIYNETMPEKEFKKITASKEPVPEILEQENEVKEEEALPEEQKKPEVTKEIISTPEAKLMLFAKCLTDKNVRMFSASWSPDSEAQLALFENYASSLNVVECESSVKGANVALCDSVLKKQFPTWPTWEINGILYEGIQFLNALSRYTGCEY